MRSHVMDEVATIMRQAAAEAILPRYRKLLAGDIEEETPLEVVTVADRQAEQIISSRLAALLPGSRVVGEEAVATIPSLMEGLDEGQVWLLDPVSGQLSLASRGDGAFIDGIRVRASEIPLSASGCRGSVLTWFLPEELKEQVKDGSARLGAVLPGAKCAGVDYPSITRGTRTVLLFWRLLPWDHAPGALLVDEAGGHVARLDGSEYRPSDQRPGLLVAQNQDVWAVVRCTLRIGRGK